MTEPSARRGDLEDQKHEAIKRLDFELAYNLAQELLRLHESSLADQHQSFLEQIQRQAADDHEDIDAQRQRIEADQEEEIANLKREYQRAARILATKHRQEANQLVDKWRITYYSTARDLETRVESSNISARILAECSSFESAISLRNGTKDFCKPQLIDCCAAFKRQFDFMCRRHEGEFDQLYTFLRNSVFALKQYEKEVMLTAEAEYARRESDRKAILVNDVLQNIPDPVVRKAAIEQISPRRAERKGIGSHHTPVVQGYRPDH